MRFERRRRVLPDDAVETGTPARSASSERPREEPPRNYAEAAAQARERALHTLFPLRWWSISLVVAACLLGVGGCIALHLLAERIAPPLPQEAVTWLQLGAAGSPGRWLASTLLTLSAAAAAFVYSLRRHRLDDYHGRYRMWIWMAIACLLFGLAETTGLPGLVRAACQLAGERAGVQGALVWSIAVGTVAGAIGVRLFFEIRRCGSAVAALLFAVLGFSTAAATLHGWPVAWNAQTAPLVGRGAWLAGYAMVVLTFLLYGRHVQLDVTGVRVTAAKKKKQAKPAKREKTAAATSSEAEARAAKPALRLRTDLEPPDIAEPKQEAPTWRSEGEQPAEENPAVVGSTHTPKKLSKAERRRMRREARMAS